MATKPNLKAKDMVELLRTHYLPENRPPAGIFASEIGSPDGKRFADAIWQSTTRSGGLLFVGHEIKVSRADVAVELADPTKAEPWMQYCDQWWLTISDPALIDGLKIPDAWGVMAPPSGRRKISMTVIKEAPLLKPVSKEPGLVRLMTWYAQSQREEIREMNIEKTTLENKIRNLQHDVQSAKTGRPVDYEEQKVFDIYQEYKKRLKAKGDADPYGSYGVGKNEREDIIDTLVDLRSARLLERKIDSENRAIVNAISAMSASVQRTEELLTEVNKVTRLDKSKW